ncbi:unnamed protein product, partial [Staurois parvus]
MLITGKCNYRVSAALSSRCQRLSERGSAPIIRALIISARMIGAQQCHPPVPPTCVQQCCLPMPPTSVHQCHPPVSSSAAYLCP